MSKCLDSVVNQTFRDFEIIIVDDCSDESSQDSCKTISISNFSFTVYILEKSIGPGGARNRGLEAAKEIMFCLLIVMTGLMLTVCKKPLLFWNSIRQILGCTASCAIMI